MFRASVMECLCLAERWIARQRPLTAATWSSSRHCSPQIQTQYGSHFSLSLSLLRSSSQSQVCKQSDTSSGHVSLISCLAATNQPFTGLIVCNLRYLACLDYTPIGHVSLLQGLLISKFHLIKHQTRRVNFHPKSTANSILVAAKLAVVHLSAPKAGT